MHPGIQLVVQKLFASHSAPLDLRYKGLVSLYIKIGHVGDPMSSLLACNNDSVKSNSDPGGQEYDTICPLPV